MTDRLVRLGAQVLIVPTMDVTDWGRHEHDLHARIAPVRAAEYGIPVFRVASSGISQSVDELGCVTASAPFPSQLATIQGVLAFHQSGRLPIDRVLAWISVLVTAATVGCLAFILFRQKGKTCAGETVSLTPRFNAVASGMKFDSPANGS